MRRGFKAEAERLAERTRRDMGLANKTPADPRELAKHLKIEVVSAADLVAVKRLRELQHLQADAFSAATFHLPNNRIVIVYNPLNETSRTNSDLAHELSHILLAHDVREIRQVAGHTFFTCDREQEEEANWLGGCLLLPRPLLLRAAYNDLTPEDLADRYEVSIAMARFRLNTSGVLLQARRARTNRRHM